MIPKKIHYCWLSGDPFPEDIAQYMQSWQEKLPEYEFILWDTKRFDLESSIWCKQAFDAKKYAFAADYIRMYAVYHEGGIYLDCDIEVLKSFNDALKEDIMMAYEQQSKNVLEAGCFGAVKNHAFIRDCLDYYRDREFIQKDGNYDMKFLPQIMYEIMQKNYDDTEILKFPPMVFTSKSSIDGSINITPEHYCIHHFKSHYLNPKMLEQREKNWELKRNTSNSPLTNIITKGRMFLTILENEGLKATVKRYKGSLYNQFKNR